MKTILALFVSLSLLCGAAPASEAVDAELFPAEFLFKQRDTLGISDPQIQAIGGIMQQAKPLFDEGKRQLDEAMGVLQKILRIDRPDGTEAEEKMRAVLDCEGEIKMLQLRTLLAVRAELTPEQLVKARQLRDELIARNAADVGRRERVEKKLEQLRAAIKTKSAAGEVAPEMVARAKGIYELLTAGKDDDAEKQIDEFLGQIGDGKARP